MAGTCAESKGRECKAYITDCLMRLTTAYNQCDKQERVVLRKNVNEMIDRMKQLYNGEK